MTTVPLPPDPTVSIVDQIIQGLIYDAGTQFIISWAIGYVPFLGFPIIKQIFTYVVESAAQALSTNFQKVLALQIIGFKTDQQRDAYEDAISALILATSGGKPSDIDKATQDVRSSLANLVHFTV